MRPGKSQVNKVIEARNDYVNWQDGFIESLLALYTALSIFILTGGVRLGGHPAGFCQETDQMAHRFQFGFINDPVITILLQTG